MMYPCLYCGVLCETEAEQMKHEQVCEFITGGKKVYKNIVENGSRKSKSRP